MTPTKTKTRGFNLFPHEAKAGEHLRCIVRPVKPQPVRTIGSRSDAEHGEVVMYQGWPHRLAASRGRNARDAGFLTPMPLSYFPPGTEVCGREKFYIDLNDYLDGPLPAVKPPIIASEDIYYLADGACCEQIPECACVEMGKPRWRPASQMPEWASRFSISFKGVEVKRVNAIANDELLHAGMTPIAFEDGSGQPDYCDAAMQFQHWWDSTFKSLPWSTSPWAWFYQVEVKRK